MGTKIMKRLSKHDVIGYNGVIESFDDLDTAMAWCLDEAASVPGDHEDYFIVQSLEIRHITTTAEEPTDP